MDDSSYDKIGTKMEDEETDKRMFCTNIRHYFREYCAYSSLHGIRYMGEYKRTYFERGWWFVIFCITVGTCGYLVSMVYSKWSESPVIVSFATIERPVYDIPFPAITICPETKINRNLYNFTAAEARLWLENKDDLKNATKRKIYHFFNMVCDNEDGIDFVKNFYIEENGTDTDVLGILDPTKYPHPVKGCKYVGEDIENCSKIFKPILTDEGICYTFNLLDKSVIFQDDVNFPKKFFETNISREQWNIETGYAKEADMLTWPIRALSAGVKSAFVIDLHTAKNQTDLTCKSVQGYRITLHIPMRIPMPSQQYFRVPHDQVVLGLLRPDIMETSDKVKDFSVETRQCFFTDEKKLKFFKIYSQQNCLLECLTNFTKYMCNCTSFFMPRDHNTKLCGIKKLDCLEKASFFLKMLELYDIQKSKIVPLPPTTPKCKCLPLCNDLTYNVETSQSPWQWQDKYKNFTEKDDHMSRVQIFFQNSRFISHQRHELYGLTDFVANFGGLLGLFTGVSVLSVMELFYFLTLRLYFNVKLYGQWHGKDENN